MYFSDANLEWQPLPRWASFLIRLGYRWPSAVSGQRRIALVSMPCDSAAAGLIGLGAFIRDLASSGANDVNGHFDALLRYALQYLECCRDCEMRCRPQIKLCGYAAEATGRVRHQRTTYVISPRTDFVERQFVVSGRSGWWQIDSRRAKEWRIDGEPPPESVNADAALPHKPYAQIVEDAQIIPENLLRSFSGLCLAGRVAGESTSREAYASIRFCCDSGEYGLPELLAVHGWGRSNIVSRTSFFNARTGDLDRRASLPALVVADGDASFLKVLGRPEFQRSDVIGVIHRTIERDRLEALGDKMLGLRQWYVEDPEIFDRLANAPRGIGISILRKGRL